MSQFSKKQQSYLQEKFGSRVSFHKTERKLYGHDIAALPSLVNPFWEIPSLMQWSSLRMKKNLFSWFAGRKRIVFLLHHGEKLHLAMVACYP